MNYFEELVKYYEEINYQQKQKKYISFCIFATIRISKIDNKNK
jgi:hypothetical protein